MFAGGGSLGAVEAVCSGNSLEKSEVLELLTHLVDKSLVMANRVQGAEPRYYLLETIRQYGREKLNGSGEGEVMRERHARWYAELAEMAEPHIFGHGQIEWLDRLEQEHDNVRAALEWSLHNDVDLGLHITSALAYFWQLRNHFMEGYQQMRKLLAAGPSDPSLVHAKALTWAGVLAGFAQYDGQSISLASASIAMSRELGYLEGQALSHITLALSPYLHGDNEKAQPLAEAGLALFEQTANQWGIRHACAILGNIIQANGDFERAHILFQKSLALSREIGDIDGISWSLYLLGNLASNRGDFEKAMADYQESLRNAREVRNKILISWIRARMGRAAIQLGDYGQARALLDESTVLMRELCDFPCVAGALTNLGLLARLQGEYDQAIKFYSESLRLAWKIDGRDSTAWSIAGLAELYALCGQPRKAARLLAAVQDVPETHEYIKHYLFSDWRRELGQIVDTIRSRLDEPTFQVEQEFGRQMSLGDTVAYALEGTTE